MSVVAAAPRYLAVGALCAALNNILLIGGDALHLSLPASIALSFGIVCLVGYVLHAAITFGMPASWSGLGRYVMAMVAGLPASALLLWLFTRALDWPMAIAAPFATGATLLINFIVSRWAVTRPAGRPAPGTPS